MTIDNGEIKMGILYNILGIIILVCTLILISEIYLDFFIECRESKRAKILKVLVPVLLLIYLIICILDGLFYQNIEDDIEGLFIVSCLAGCSVIVFLWWVLNNK